LANDPSESKRVARVSDCDGMVYEIILIFMDQRTHL